MREFAPAPIPIGVLIQLVYSVVNNCEINPLLRHVQHWFGVGVGVGVVYDLLRLTQFCSLCNIVVTESIPVPVANGFTSALLSRYDGYAILLVNFIAFLLHSDQLIQLIIHRNIPVSD